MTSETITATAGVIISLAFFYVPGLKTWYDAQTGQAKALVMLGVLFVVSAAAFGFACAGFADDLGIAVTCDESGGWGMVRAFIAALTANQMTYVVARNIWRGR